MPPACPLQFLHCKNRVQATFTKDTTYRIKRSVVSACYEALVVVIDVGLRYTQGAYFPVEGIVSPNNSPKPETFGYGTDSVIDVTKRGLSKLGVQGGDWASYIELFVPSNMLV